MPQWQDSAGVVYNSVVACCFLEKWMGWWPGGSGAGDKNRYCFGVDFILRLKNYETYNNERKKQVFASNSNFQIKRFR